MRRHILYYVSPKSGHGATAASRPLKRMWITLAVLFPFEKTLYDQENVPCDYVGHPLVAQT